MIYHAMLQASDFVLGFWGSNPENMGDPTWNESFTFANATNAFLIGSPDFSSTFKTTILIDEPRCIGHPDFHKQLDLNERGLLISDIVELDGNNQIDLKRANVGHYLPIPWTGDTDVQIYVLDWVNDADGNPAPHQIELRLSSL